MPSDLIEVGRWSKQTVTASGEERETQYRLVIDPTERPFTVRKEASEPTDFEWHTVTEWAFPGATDVVQNRRVQA